jgi:hypothetical protein
MPNLRDIIAGLEIFQATYCEPTDYCIARHDLLFAPKADVSEEDAGLLRTLGWFYDEEHELWCAFV